MRVLSGLEAFSAIKKAPQEALFSYGRPKSSLLTAVTGSTALFRTLARGFFAAGRSTVLKTDFLGTEYSG